MPLPFEISLDLALGGPGAIPKSSYDAALKEAGAALAWLKTQKLELFDIVDRTDDIAAAQAVADQWKDNSSDIAVLGIGGSSLGGQALKAIAKAGHKPRVTFHDNPDPWSWQQSMAGFDLKTTRFIVISKSGGTAETLFQAITAADAIEKAGGGKYLKHHFAAITEPKKSVLADFADSMGAPKLDHPLGIGGRYSVLSMVGVLPALLMDLDVVKLRAGARAVRDSVLNAPSVAHATPAAGAALHHALAKEGKLTHTVMWNYADRLKTLAAWWQQLWAESLGKDGKGTSPIGAVGPVDQHSQLQLFRDGPNDALYTVIAPDTKGQGLAAPADRSRALGLDYLVGKTMGDLIAAEAKASAETLSRNRRPVRQIRLPVIDEYSIGALMMHFMLETILMGRLMGVDPFDQPGVEESKVLTRKYLAE
ncbi:MAG: glucose-6-phosphate isomerase [Alphaproteobacteria bacterium]|nr:glucose-6-phosphate isomerase [Alphaproteobacteria bacterium]MBL7099168.1 glucose-6-phosphate isomerase [Alphaproteobacteria bacterium]